MFFLVLHNNFLLLALKYVELEAFIIFPCSVFFFFLLCNLLLFQFVIISSIICINSKRQQREKKNCMSFMKKIKLLDDTLQTLHNILIIHTDRCIDILSGIYLHRKANENTFKRDVCTYTSLVSHVQSNCLNDSLTVCCLFITLQFEVTKLKGENRSIK